MSNCIDFLKGKLFVKTTDAFWQAYDATRSLKEEPSDTTNYFFWWFVPDFEKKSELVSWQPGCDSRSSHTNRDWNGLLSILKQLKCTYSGTFTVADEGDSGDFPLHVDSTLDKPTTE